MSALIERAHVAGGAVAAESSAATAERPAGSERDWRPRLLEGTELIGRMEGSGLREPPYLIRRVDGQVVQLSGLLFVIASHLDGSDLATVAERVGSQIGKRVSPEQVAFVAERKFVPLGLVAARDGSTITFESVSGMLGLRFRAGVLPERAVRPVAGALGPLFWAPVVLAALVALVLCDVWIAAVHGGIGRGVAVMIHRPALGLVLFGLVIVSLLFHEFGHAAACRYGGARPGRIGVGIYLVWPVFFSDVTDSYRLSRRGRLRTDLGGVYFNALFALAAAGVYFATGYEPLLVLVVGQQLLLVDQFVPWMRLDGYHVISDLIGVSDLFARIKPVIKSLVPGREAHPKVSELKTWARAAVTAWVLSTVTVLSALGFTLALYAPTYLSGAWRSLIIQANNIAADIHAGHLTAVLIAATGSTMLILPVIGLLLTYLMLCKSAGTLLATRHTRTDLTLAQGRFSNADQVRAGAPS